MIRIGIVAGEASGDTLGAGLISELSTHIPTLEVEGIGGDRLKAAGMKIIHPMEKLSVMGITEVISRYVELNKIRNDIRNHFLQNKPDIFIGIDAPDFNLWLEKELRKNGIKTVHYVSPSVWAWREYRVKKVKESVDLILNLFPFETKIYDKYGVPNCYVGHPLADKLPVEPDKKKSREELSLPKDKTIVAILPGSRSNEIKMISAPLLSAANIINYSSQDLYFACSLMNEKSLHQFNQIHNNTVPDLYIEKYVDKTHKLMEAADIIMLASGTATLEAMLLKRPMVVTYKLSWVTYFIVKLLAKIPYAALPNILAGKELVPECLQADCKPEKIAAEMTGLLNSRDKISELTDMFTQLSNQLRKNADNKAAEAVLDLLNNKTYV